MLINNNTAEQINIALLELNKKIKAIKETKTSSSTTTSSLEEGKTYNINISGSAASAKEAENALSADVLANTITVQASDTISDTAVSWKGNTDLIIPFKKLTDNTTITDETKLVGTNDDLKLNNFSVEKLSALIFDKIYPVGSIYTSTKDTSPETLFGVGTWERIKDTFLLAAGDSYTANTTGGSNSITLKSENLPSHSHSYTPAGNIVSTFTGKNKSFTAFGGNHTHTAGTNHGLGFAVDTPHSSAHGAGSYGSYISNVTYSGNLSVSGTFTPTGNVVSTFTGSNLTTNAVGSGSSFSILPPYLTVYVWKRVA